MICLCVADKVFILIYVVLIFLWQSCFIYFVYTINSKQKLSINIIMFVYVIYLYNSHNMCSKIRNCVFRKRELCFYSAKLFEKQVKYNMFFLCSLSTYCLQAKVFVLLCHSTNFLDRNTYHHYVWVAFFAVIVNKLIYYYV